jgi:CTP synthase (UTP-ammonia lyase)
MVQQPALIAVVGDRNPSYAVHVATDRALTHGEHAPEIEWLATDAIEPRASDLARYAGFLVAPGSPYRSMEGALHAIRYAREHRVPLLGTCGGFQHLIVEFMRDVAGIPDAEHAESSPAAPHLGVTALACSLAGQTHAVRIVAGTRAAAIYQMQEILEAFFCSYGLNPDYRSLLESHGLVISGVGPEGEARIVELPSQPFFIGTLYVPQARHEPGKPHPLVGAFVDAARRRHADARAGRAA